MNRSIRKVALAAPLLLGGVLCGASRADAAEPSSGGRARPEGATSALPQSGIQYLDLMQRYLNLMEGFAHVAEDPAAAGLAATIGAKDLLAAEGGEAKAIEFFNQVLPEVRNEAVQRAIRIELADLYKRTGQRDKALEQFRILITTAPPGTTSAASPKP